MHALPDPGDLTGYRGRVGRVLYFDVVGSTDGTVWGTEVYTDDSALATAAVHAGAVQDGQRGIVRVTILPGLKHYEGSTANGVSTREFDSWYGSYVIDAGPSAQPSSAPASPGRVGEPLRWGPRPHPPRQRQGRRHYG